MHIYDIADHHTIFKHLNLRSFEKKVNSLPKGLQNLKCFETEILILNGNEKLPIYLDFLRHSSNGKIIIVSIEFNTVNEKAKFIMSLLTD